MSFLIYVPSFPVDNAPEKTWQRWADATHASLRHLPTSPHGNRPEWGSEVQSVSVILPSFQVIKPIARQRRVLKVRLAVLALLSELGLVCYIKPGGVAVSYAYSSDKRTPTALLLT